MKPIIIPEQIRAQWDAAIDRGMAFLDDYFEGPEWIDQIDLEELDLFNSNTCVCGQLFHPLTGNRTVDQEDIRNGYYWATSYVMEHDVIDFSTVTVPLGEDEDAAVMTELGFCIIREEDIEDVIEAANPHVHPSKINAWKLFTQRWYDRIEKRRADLGSVAA